MTMPDPRTFMVFSQENAARLDVSAWNGHAARFFDAGVTLEPGDAPTDSVRVRLVLRAKDCGVRSVATRPRAPSDLAMAEAAERTSGGAGLSLLAKRCPTVLLVTLESERDATALLLASIIASVVLGPIVTPARDVIWGVRTARAELEKMMG
jgi:hypothetical protein